MVWSYHGQPVPLEVYHGVPSGWSASDVIREHQRLGGSVSLVGPEATEPGAPSWLPERRAWLQYRATLYRVADGLSANDPACTELAVRYIELRYIGSYSGFIRSLLARRRRHCTLSETQKTRLHEHFSSLVLAEQRTQEFRDYVKLWRSVMTQEQRDELMARIRKQSDGDARAAWLAAQLHA